MAINAGIQTGAIAMFRFFQNLNKFMAKYKDILLTQQKHEDQLTKNNVKFANLEKIEQRLDELPAKLENVITTSINQKLEVKIDQLKKYLEPELVSVPVSGSEIESQAKQKPKFSAGIIELGDSEESKNGDTTVNNNKTKKLEKDEKSTSALKKK